MSQIVVHDGTVHPAGQVGEGIFAGVERQAYETLTAIKRLLEEAGTGKIRILLTTVYLKDINADFEGMNRIWDQWLPHGVAPTRATVEAKLCEPEVLAGMSVVIVLP